MTCTACGAALLAGAKFCAECGTPAVAACRVCGTQLGPPVKFCPECGTPVAAGAAAPPELSSSHGGPVAERRVTS
ncbi:MAG: zinc-ribbon domain-containing protein, partial [Jatrophihabitans sp.]|uniref:zinc-ribbon domain-containing protein n=1 Tax=Jatrophihabitans sp. TaxID=1932789 RepID=UPI003916ADE9